MTLRSHARMRSSRAATSVPWSSRSRSPSTMASRSRYLRCTCSPRKWWAIVRLVRRRSHARRPPSWKGSHFDVMASRLDALRRSSSSAGSIFGPRHSRTNDVMSSCPGFDPTRALTARRMGASGASKSSAVMPSRDEGGSESREESVTRDSQGAARLERGQARSGRGASRLERPRLKAKRPRLRAKRPRSRVRWGRACGVGGRSGSRRRRSGRRPGRSSPRPAAADLVGPAARSISKIVGEMTPPSIPRGE